MQESDIDWCTHTWNLFTGCWGPGGTPEHPNWCPGCYAKRTAENEFYGRAFPNKFIPTFHPERLREPGRYRKPAIIFSDSMSDFFGDWFKTEDILSGLNIMNEYRGAHWHKFVILTKNPERMYQILRDYQDPPEYLKNVYFGTSVTGNGSIIDPICEESTRLFGLRAVHDLGYNTVISFEPLTVDPRLLIIKVGGIDWVDWIVTGALTKQGRTVTPLDPTWITSLIRSTRCNIPVLVKRNAQIYEQIGNRPRFPADLLPIAQYWGKA